MNEFSITLNSGILNTYMFQICHKVVLPYKNRLSQNIFYLLVISIYKHRAISIKYTRENQFSVNERPIIVSGGVSEC